MIIALEIALLVCAVFALVCSYGIDDYRKRILSVCASVALFVILVICIGVLR